MMEQADTCKGHGNAVLVASLDNMVVTNTASSLCYIFHTALVGTFYVVAKREECV